MVVDRRLEEPRLNEVRGPLGATKASLRRIGWKAANAFTLITDLGQKLILTASSPRLVENELSKAIARMHERKALQKLETGTSSDSRILSHHFKTILASRKFDEIEKGCLRAVACCATWTQEDLFRARSVVARVCQKCGEDIDTLHHRWWHCPAVAEQRAETLSRF